MELRLSLIGRFCKIFGLFFHVYNRAQIHHGGDAWVAYLGDESRNVIITDEFKTSREATNDLDRRLRVLLEKVLGDEEL